MMTTSKGARLPHWRSLAAAGVLWAATLPTLGTLESGRAAIAPAPVERSPGEVVSTTLLGGARAIAVDFLMVRAQGHWEEGRFYELTGIYETVTRMVPRIEAGWIYLSWNLAFNVSLDVADPVARWGYIREGIRLCQEGRARNPSSWRLPSWEAHIILEKCAPSPDLAARLESDRVVNPSGLSPGNLALARGWEAISTEGHGFLADRIVHEALSEVLRSEGGPSPEWIDEARRFLSHLAEDGEGREVLKSAWEENLRAAERRR